MKDILIKVKSITALFFITACLLVMSGIRAHGQIITTVAGKGTTGYTGDGGPATAAQFYHVAKTCLDDSGNIYIADSYNNVVRKVSALTGIVNTIAGTGYGAGQNYGGHSGDGGPATAAELNAPSGVAVDDSGNVFISDYANFAVRKVTVKTGLISTVAGQLANGGYSGDGGQATAAQLSYVTAVTFDDSGNLYISDQWNWVIRKVAAKTGIITTIAGDNSKQWGNGGNIGNGGQATDAALYLPSDMTVDDSGNVYIADEDNNEMREVSKKTGIITDYAGSETAAAGYSGDGGPATAAEIDNASGIGIDDSGDIYIADGNNQLIRKVSAKTGIITTVAGHYNNGTPGYSGNGGLATSNSVSFNYPNGVAFDKCGNFYIADYQNNVVRKVTVANDSIKVSPVNPSLCSGGSDTLTASGAGTYSWSPSTGLSDTTGSMVIANPTMTTTYTISGTGICSGTATPDIIVVTVAAAPRLTVTQQPSLPTCSGQPVTISINGGGSNFTWSPSTGLSATSGSSVIATPSDTTIYTVTGTSGGCSSTGMDTVNIVPAPALLIKPQDTTICNGSSVTLFAPSSGSGYSWLPTATLSSAAADSVIATPTVQTTYTVNGTDSVGCAATGTDIIYVNAGFNKPIIADTNNLITSTATQGNQWYKDGHAISGATGESYTATDTGCYYDIATNIANGCSSISNTLCIDKLAGINLLTINPNLLSIYPNPTGGEIFVNISSSVSDVKDWNLQIMDVLGRTVYTKLSLNYSNDIDLSNLPGGVYFITVINKTGRSVFTVVKQN